MTDKIKFIGTAASLTVGATRFQRGEIKTRQEIGDELFKELEARTDRFKVLKADAADAPATGGTRLKLGGKKKVTEPEDLDLTKVVPVLPATGFATKDKAIAWAAKHLPDLVLDKNRSLKGLNDLVAEAYAKKFGGGDAQSEGGVDDEGDFDTGAGTTV